MKLNSWLVMSVLVPCFLAGCANTDLTQPPEEEASTPSVDSQVQGLEEGSEIQSSSTSAQFVKVKRKGLNPAWKDSSGMVWGDVARDVEGNDRYFKSRRAAARYCERRGAMLPTAQDFERLRQYMGAEANSYHGYRAQILPHLSRNEWIWSSTTKLGDGKGPALGFVGAAGTITSKSHDIQKGGVVRCVIQE